jgi:hypothetical protein
VAPELVLGTAVICIKSINPFEAQYAEKMLIGAVSAAATCDELQTISKQVAMTCSPPGTKFSGDQKHFEVEQPLYVKKFSHACVQLSWSR